MLILGLLAVVQITFLPGALLLRGLRFSGSAFKHLLLAFGLSLVINYAAVILLVALGGYTRPVVLAGLALELAVLFFPARRGWRLSVEDISARALSWLECRAVKAAAFFRELRGQQPAGRFSQFARLLFFALAAVLAVDALIWLARVFYFNLGTVFNSWDAVLSWNRWAEMLAANRLPDGTAHYPQLLPANLSIPYVLTGSPAAQLFAKAVMPLFTLVGLLMMLDLAITYRSAGFLVAIVITRYMLKKLTGVYIPEGYADLPVAFFALAAVYCLVHIRHAASPAQRQPYLWAGALLAAGAAVTKQAGICLFLLYPLLLWVALRASPLRSDLRPALRPLLASVLVVIPWYVYKQITIQAGLDASELTYLTTTIHAIENPLERLLPAFTSLGKYGYLFLLLIPLALLLDELYRWLAFALVLPFGLLWAAYFSYEVRNVALVLPVLGLLIGLGIERLFRLALQALDRLRLTAAPAVPLALAAVVALAITGILLVPDGRLEARQTEQETQIFSPSINARLYELFPEPSPDLRILTNYPIAYLPGFEANQASFFFRSYAEYVTLRDDPAIAYILLPSSADGAIVDEVMSRVEQGEYQLIFEDDSYGHYALIRIR